MGFVDKILLNFVKCMTIIVNNLNSAGRSSMYSGQYRTRSDCTSVKADLVLHCPQNKFMVVNARRSDTLQPKRLLLSILSLKPITDDVDRDQFARNTQSDPESAPAKTRLRLSFVCVHIALITLLVTDVVGGPLDSMIVKSHRFNSLVDLL